MVIIHVCTCSICTRLQMAKRQLPCSTSSKQTTTSTFGIENTSFATKNAQKKFYAFEVQCSRVDSVVGRRYVGAVWSSWQTRLLQNLVRLWQFCTRRSAREDLSWFKQGSHTVQKWFIWKNNDSRPLVAVWLHMKPFRGMRKNPVCNDDCTHDRFVTAEIFSCSFALCNMFLNACTTSWSWTNMISKVVASHQKETATLRSLRAAVFQRREVASWLGGNSCGSTHLCTKCISFRKCMTDLK